VPLVLPTACLTNTSQGADGIRLVSKPEHRDKNNAAPNRGGVTDVCAEHTDGNHQLMAIGKPDWVCKYIPVNGKPDKSEYKKPQREIRKVFC
jgi:hypothetical protein